MNQLFFHVVCSSMVANAAFVTLDRNFLDRAAGLHSRYGVTVLSPNETWDIFAPRYSLVTPTEVEMHRLVNQHEAFFRSLRTT